MLYVITYMWNLKVQQTSEYSNKKADLEQADGYHWGEGIGEGQLRAGGVRGTND